MAIKWSAIKVSEAMDEVEHQVFLAYQFITGAKTRAQDAKGIPNLPQYMKQRLNSLIDQLERMEYIKSAINSVRKDIPDGAIEAEQESQKYSSQQSII